MGEDRRALLEAAFSKAEEESKETADVAATSEIPAKEPYQVEAEAANRTEQQEPAKPEGQQEPAKPEGQQEPAKPEGQQEPAKPTEADTAPISWTKEEKALWAKVPQEVRGVIQRREKQIQQALSQTAQVRKFGDEFARIVAPHSHLIRAQNSTPLQAVHNLMNTAAGLMTGNQQQKAAIIAEIITNYGVDLETLDKTLTAAPQNPNAGHAALPPQFAQALQPIYQFMEQVNGMRSQSEARQREAAEEEVGRMAAKPYFEELREDMADLMEIAANRGRTMSLEDAYTRALAAHPVYSKAVTQNQIPDLSTAAATLARARKASSTVRGAPNGGAPAQKAPASRREALERAWDNPTE